MLEKIKKLLTPLNLLVLFLLLAALALRIYRVNEILGFYYDQGRDALVIWDLIHKGKLFLIGPTTGIAGIFRGPFYYYLIAPFYFLGRGNPVWPDVFLALTSVGALWLMYHLAKKIGGVTAGIVALILGGFSFEIVYASRWLSNPTPMLILSMILVWSLFCVNEGKKWAWMVILPVLGLSLFHFGSSGELFYFPAVFIFAVWQFFLTRKGTRNIPNLKTILISLGLFILTVLPLVLFDLKHGGILEGNIKGFIVTGSSFGFPKWPFILNRFTEIFTYFSQLIFHAIYEKETVILFAIFGGMIFVLSDLLKNEKVKIVVLLLVCPVLGLVFFQGNYGNFYMYYLTGYFLIFLLLVSVALGYIFDKSIFGKLLVVALVYLFLANNYPIIKGYLTTTGSENNTIIFANEKLAINWIYKDAGETKFNVDEYVPPVIPYSYEYLLTWMSNSNNVTQQVPLLYTLSEADPDHPDRLQAWLDRQKGIGKIIKEEQFGGITVQKRERIETKK